MTNLKRKLLALAMISVISGGTFAQKRGEDKRPPKDKDNRVVVKPKNERPPQQKERDDKKRDDRRGKP
ncbi:MAG TPA: hypothetical protein VMM84_08655 [Pyrinomonadaceae bacterium]|nr:hypothetical protein [Pyrinomonadaceae bacterium]